MPTPTPFHSRTSAICESHEWRNWSGYLAAVTYEPSHEREYWAIRNAAALIDVSPLYKYEITGGDAACLVDRIIPRDISRCRVGQVLYTPWCDEAGRIIDDGTVQRLDEDRFRVTSTDPGLRWFQDCGIGMDVRVVDVSRDLAALALQGPNARAILGQLAEHPDPNLNTLKFFHLARARIEGFDVTITRTGYTGDLGYEIWVEPEHADRLWDALIEAGRGYGLQAAGLAALDIARIEAGLLLKEVDYVSAWTALIEARKSSPYEAGLGWAVRLDKPAFVGRRALMAERERPAIWRLVGLEVDWADLERVFATADLPPLVSGRASRLPVPVYRGGRQIGQATSSAFSPILKKYIALATIEARSAEPGTTVDFEITVEFRRMRARATVVRTPLFDPERKRSCPEPGTR
jgi:aminomethyltransferase